MSHDFVMGFCIGWFFGCVGIWLYFANQRLIRSRSEWYGDRRRRGLPVPDNWMEDNP